VIITTKEEKNTNNNNNSNNNSSNNNSSNDHQQQSFEYNWITTTIILIYPSFPMISPHGFPSRGGLCAPWASAVLAPTPRCLEHRGTQPWLFNCDFTIILCIYIYIMYIIICLEIYRLNEHFLASRWFQTFCLKPFLGRSNVFSLVLTMVPGSSSTPGLFHLFAKRHCPVSSTMCFWFSWWFPIAILPDGTWGILNDPLHKGWSSSHECRVFYTQYFRNPTHDAWMTAAAIAQSTTTLPNRGL
jgi:hypothetical protein